MRTIWFTSDQHFGHANIIKYCARPFSSVQEMNETVIENYNAVIKPTDVVYHLGDFAFKNKNLDVNAIYNRLNGIKFFVKGNHDTGYTVRLFGAQNTYNRTKVNGITLCHFPLLDEKIPVVFHGHIHERWKVREFNGIRINVGVDVWDFKPVSMEQLHACYNI